MALFELSNMLASWFGRGAEPSAPMMSSPGYTAGDEDDGYERDVFGNQLVLSRAIESAPGRPMRLLCLHGRGSNNDITGIQLVSLNLHTRVHVDLVRGDVRCGPASSAFRMLSESSRFYAWFGDLELTRRTVEDAMRRVLEVVAARGPFDGIYGFSQGAAVAACLSLPGMAQALGGTRTWSFIICACGVDMGMPQARGILPDADDLRVDLPSLHIIGDEDPFRRLSLGLARACDSPTVLSHPFGHELPVALRKDPRFIREAHDFLLRRAQPQPAAS